MKWTTLGRLTSISALSVIAVSCSTTSGTFCDLAEPYRPAQGETYTDQNKRWVIRHNTTGERQCGWKF